MFLLVCTGILTPNDEFQYWAETAMSAPSRNQKERAAHMQELFQPISKDYGCMDSLSLLECMEVIEVTQDTLDEVWKQSEVDPVYPEKRMKHLMEVIGKLVSVYEKLVIFTIQF